MHLGSEYIFGETATRSLYGDNGYSSVAGADGAINDYVSLIDLQTIRHKLMKDAILYCNRNGKLQQRYWIYFMYQAVGRGGNKVKFQDFTEWMWHPKYEALDIGWPELKLLEKYMRCQWFHTRIIILWISIIALLHFGPLNVVCSGWEMMRRPLLTMCLELYTV
jgi:hypothetical protein